MDRITSIAQTLIADESGVTAIEYALIGTLVVIGAIAGFSAFGTALNGLFEDFVAKALEAISSRP